MAAHRLRPGSSLGTSLAASSQMCWHELLAGLTPTAPPSFGVQTQAELFGLLNRGDVGSGILIADRPAVLIGGGLSKHAAEFDFPRACRLVRRLAGTCIDPRTSVSTASRSSWPVLR